MEVVLDYERPLAVVPLRRFLAAHAIPGLERYDSETKEHTRLVPAPSGPVLVTVTLPDDGGPIRARLHLGDAADLPAVLARVRHWLDLDADAEANDAALATDPLLRPCVESNSGLRVPGTVNGAELAMLAVLGQQVSLAAARTFAARLVAAVSPPGVAGLRQFPSPAAISALGPERIKEVVGLTGARSRTLHGLAEALAAGLELHPKTDWVMARTALLRLPGIGPWTTEYIALRALGDPDAYPSGDLVLRRALGVGTAAQAETRAAAWRPRRGYALLHLWTREVFS